MFEISFETDNAAFAEFDDARHEIARILRDMALMMEDGLAMVADDGPWGSYVIDLNGNKIGTWSLELETDDDDDDAADDADEV